MRFVCVIYILMIVFIQDKFKETFLVQCITDLTESELIHLSRKLNALECLQLVQAAYELAPTSLEHTIKKHAAFSENLHPTTSKECLFNLEQWNNDFPKDRNPSGRFAIELTLRWLGRPDLAKYVRENYRSIRSLDTEDYDMVESLEFPGYKLSKRNTQKKDTHGQKSKMKKKKKRHHDVHKPQHKGVKKAISVGATHSDIHKGHQAKKEDNCPHNHKHRSICWSIIVIMLFFIVCFVAAYYFHKRKQKKARGTRFKYDRSRIKEDKDTFTDCLEWDDDAICSCSDVEGGCTGKCDVYSRTDRIPNHQICTDDSLEDLNNYRKVKKKKEKKKQRFSFLQKTFQNKKSEKDQENQDRKCVKTEDFWKILEKIVIKKREKAPSILQKDQCACCRCAMNAEGDLFYEKKEDERREIQRWKAKRKKEEKRKRREELRKAEKYANVCFNETCK